ncbi:hypothetical protein [Streptomyces sp. NPDC056492]
MVTFVNKPTVRGDIDRFTAVKDLGPLATPEPGPYETVEAAPGVR